MAEHRTDGLQVYGVMPEIDKLYGDRFRLTFRCEPKGNVEDWYYVNKDNLFADFGTLMDAGFGESPAKPNPDSTWPNQHLVQHGLGYLTGKPDPVVTFVYETLTDAFVSETADKVDYELNGLRRVTRPVIAEDGTAYGKTVGTTTISHNEHGYGEIVLTLASAIEDAKSAEEDGYVRIIETWVEPGILALSQQLVGGNAQVSVSAFALTEAQVSAALAEVTNSNVLINQSENDYEGIKTSQFVYEVSDFEIRSYLDNGLLSIAQTELSTGSFADRDVGTTTKIDGARTLYLSSEEIDNGNTIKKRVSQWREAGLLSIKPIRESGFSLFNSYIYTTIGIPASSISGLVKPDGSALGSSVTWFEPEVDNVLGFPTYTQYVIDGIISVAATGTLVSSQEKFFTVTDPGVMSTGGAATSAETSGGAVRYPKALSQPSTYERKATVDVYMTTSATIPEALTAYNESTVDWCSIAFETFNFNFDPGSSSVSASWRNFNNFLNSAGTTDTASATSAGEYSVTANSYGSGDTTYTTTGVYRVIGPTPYLKGSDGTQYYLRTVITFV